MPIVFEDNHRCEKCMQRFNWIYFRSARSKFGLGLPVAETLPTLPTAYRVEPLENDTYKIYINCPHCGYDNRFDYKK